jgi:SnoaL-like domain
MRSFLGRYVIAIVDQKSGIERRATVSGGPVAVAAVIIALALLILFGATWKTRSVVQGMYASHLALELEAANYRVAIEALTRQLGSQQSTIADLSANSAGSSTWARLNPTVATPVLRSRLAMPTRARASSIPVAPIAVPRAAVAGERGANEAVDRGDFQEALAKSGDMRTLAEGADAALARAVEADARFRAAEMEARAQAAARDQARLADASIAAEQPPLPKVREVATVPAAAPCAESHQRSRTLAGTAADVEDAIRDVIVQYVCGLESQSVPALKRVWPSLSGREERALQTEFENARVVETAFKDPRITINGDTTTVTGFRMYSLVTQDGQRLSSVTRTTMTLRRNGNVWTIDHIVHQQ